MEMTETEVDKIISDQRRHDPGVRSGRIRISALAVRCVRHGRRIVSEESIGLPHRFYGQVNLEKELPCPECGRPCRIDRFWYEHTKNRLSVV